MVMLSSLSSWGFATTLTFGVAVVVLLAIVTADVEEEGSNGLGKHIEWQSLDDGLSLAKSEGKPLMLFIHKSWCGACKSLKPKFRDSNEIAKLSKNFVMVNTMDDDEPPGDIYRPDGGYVPRILFFNPDGDLMKDIINEDGNPDYKHYYYDEFSIITTMEKVSALFTPATSDVNDNENDLSNKNSEKTEL